jgi:hypothetical protein
MNEREPSGKPEPMDTNSTPSRPKREASLGRDVQAKIGQQLRAYYDGLIEPTPDRFADLLKQLEKSGDKGSSE